MKLIGLSGRARSGKTTLAIALSEKYGWQHLALATDLKNRCKRDFNLLDEQVNGHLKEIKDIRFGKSPRTIMIEYGKFFRSIDPEFWVKQLKQTILSIPQAQTQNYVISDVRFKNEANWIKEHGGYIIRLERAVELTGDLINDPSETELNDYAFDLRIPESMNVDMKDIQDIAEKVYRNVTFWSSLQTL